jgi:N-methylhydantoinase A/oxoprolinase/acetone carboxylase beta subunit
MRYVLQEWELPVELPAGPFGEPELAAIRGRFHAAHRARYGFAREDKPVELVTLLVEAGVPAPAVAYGRAGRNGARAAATRSVVVDPGRPAVDVAVHRREELPPGAQLEGPFLVTEPTCTVYVQPGWEAVVDAHGNLVARREAVSR